MLKQYVLFLNKKKTVEKLKIIDLLYFKGARSITIIIVFSHFS